MFPPERRRLPLFEEVEQASVQSTFSFPFDIKCVSVVVYCDCIFTLASIVFIAHTPQRPPAFSSYS